MPETFNPLPFVFVPFEPVDERPAPVASRRLGEQWPQLLDAVLLEETGRMCAALRAGFAEYAALN